MSLTLLYRYMVYRRDVNMGSTEWAVWVDLRPVMRQSNFVGLREVATMQANRSPTAQTPEVRSNTQWSSAG